MPSARLIPERMVLPAAGKCQPQNKPETSVKQAYSGTFCRGRLLSRRAGHVSMCVPAGSLPFSAFTGQPDFLRHRIHAGRRMCLQQRSHRATAPQPCSRAVYYINREKSGKSHLYSIQYCMRYIRIRWIRMEKMENMRRVLHTDTRRYAQGHFSRHAVTRQGHAMTYVGTLQQTRSDPRRDMQ